MAAARGYWLAGIAGLLIGGCAVAVAAGSFASGGGGEAVRAYLLEHPEVIPEAMEVLRKRETGKVLDANRAAFETPFAGAWAGAEKGDVVLVEFFDYACGYCRKSNADVERLLKEDPRLKVVWREYPVLGQASLEAAEMSLAAARQGRFRQFHESMFALGRPSAQTIAQAGRAAGVAPAAAAAEHRVEIEKNYQLAQAVRSTGTPTFVIGDQVLHGAVGYEALKEAIAEARRSGRS